jgi:tetratricopeptide (TPR) repeat protein
MGVMPEIRRGTVVLYQVAHPGAELQDKLHGAIQWRLLFPLAGKVLNLPPSLLFGLAHAGCLLVLAYLVTLLRRGGLRWLACGATTLVLGGTSWFFTSMSWLGYYDSWLVLGLLVVAFGRARLTVWAACVWAPWIDERFALAAPLALLCRYYYVNGRAEAAQWKREASVAAGLVGLFVAVRLGVLGAQSGATATAGGYFARFQAFDATFSRLLFGMWTGLRVAWALVGLAVLLLWRRNASHGLILASATVALVVIGLATAQDLSRSMMLVFPVAVLGALWSSTAGAVWMKFAPAAAAVALLLPAHHVMNDGVKPVYYLYHEIAAIDDPPPGARAEAHELRGIQAMQRGDLVAAAEALSLAIKLAPNPASAAKQRGVLFASQQQWAAARQDFAMMVEHEPKDPDGWFLRAQAALALGDRAAAEADAAKAMSVAPKGWMERTDVARFFARLQGGK